MPSRLNISPSDRILVVAPHPDDESIGCGGLLSLYGPQCDVLLLSDGRLGKSLQRNNCTEEEIAAIREREFKQATAIAHVRAVYCLRIKDKQVKDNYKVIAAFDYSPYQYIFIPNGGHIDHFFANLFFRRMRFWHKIKAYLFVYEVWNTLGFTTSLLDISSVCDVKKEMISVYKSQLESFDYIEAISSLNRYRGMHDAMNSAEAYYHPTSTVSEYCISLLRKVFMFLGNVPYVVLRVRHSSNMVYRL